MTALVAIRRLGAALRVLQALTQNTGGGANPGYAFLRGKSSGGGYVTLRGKMADGRYINLQGKVA